MVSLDDWLRLLRLRAIWSTTPRRHRAGSHTACTVGDPAAWPRQDHLACRPVAPGSGTERSMTTWRGAPWPCPPMEPKITGSGTSGFTLTSEVNPDAPL